MNELITLPWMYKEGGLSLPKSGDSPLKSCNATEVEFKTDRCLQCWWKESTTIWLLVLFLESALPHYLAAVHPCSSDGIQAIRIARQCRKRLHSCQSSSMGFSVEGGKQRRYFNMPSFQALLRSDQSTTQAVFHWEASQPLAYKCHVFSFSLKWLV